MRRTAFLLALLLLAPAAHAARVTVGSGAGAPGGTANVPISFAAEGASVAAFSVNILFSTPLSFSSAAISAAASTAGKVINTNPISGGVQIIIYGLNQSQIPDGVVATITFGIASGASNGSYTVTAANASGADPSGNAVTVSQSSGSVTVGGSGGTVATFFLPSSAHASGANGAFYTTDLSISNTGTTDGSFTVKFLGHDADGRGGAEYTFLIGAGRTTVMADVLGSVFSVTSGYGAIQVKATVATLAVAGQTATPAPACVGGTFGQSVPAVASTALIGTTPKSIPSIREDSVARTNLILVNAGESGLDVDVTLVLSGGSTGGTKRYSLAPLGMTQVSKVVRDLGYGGDVSGGRLVLSAATSGGTFAAYASAIDNITNDPRTLLPQ